MLGRIFLGTAAAVALLLQGCAPLGVSRYQSAGSETSGAGSAPGPSVERELRNDPRGLFFRIAQARGLAPRADVPILLDQESGFWTAFQERERHQQAEANVDTRPFYLAFNFRPQVGPETPGISGVLEEQLVGFYDPFSHSAHVRASKLGAGKTDDDMRFIVAHELGHALQDQAFGLLRPLAGASDDAQLALAAVLEADASVAAFGHLAQVHRKPLRRVLARASDFVREGTWQREIATDAHSSALRRAPVDERERLMFPYMSGLTFMSDLYRTGGFPLMNGAFRTPPTSTEQVLHPDKYLAGEGPVPVAIPEPPAGWRRVLGGRMGELLTGVVLRQCSPASGAGIGWGGDAFAIVQGAGSSVALLWSTVWDDEGAARSFADQLQGLTACWASATNRTQAFSIAASTLVKRDGTRVALVRGLDPTLAERTARTLLALPEKPPARTPPFGPLRVVPAKPRPTAAKGRFLGTSYANDMLGLLAPLPPEFTVELDKSAMSLTITRPAPSFALALLTVSDEEVSADSYVHDDNEFIRALRRAEPQLEFRFLRAARVALPLGEGIERLWALSGTWAGVKLITIPICNGNGAYLIAQAWTDRPGYDRLAQWLSLIRRTNAASPPICDELDP